jgi:hypothetical protein
VKNAVRIAVYARSPEPGRVKTRLIPALGAEGAARLYRAMAEQCIASACAALPGSVELWCTPCTRIPSCSSAETDGASPCAGSPKATWAEE